MFDLQTKKARPQVGNNFLTATQAVEVEYRRRNFFLSIEELGCHLHNSQPLSALQSYRGWDAAGSGDVTVDVQES
jgi:hypothetical protein